GRANRGGPGWFSFDMPVDPASPMAVVVTYLNEVGASPATGDFDIQVDGKSIGHFEPNPTATGFYYATYAVPAVLGADKRKIAVRLQAPSRGRIARIFGVRTIRSNGL